MGYILGNGTLVHKLGVDGQIEYTFIDATSIGEFGGERSDIDVTRLADQAKKYMGGIIDYGEIALELYATVAGYNELNANFADNEVCRYAVQFPGELEELSIQFDAYVKSCKMTGINSDEVVKISAPLKIDGTTIKKYTPEVVEKPEA